MAAVLIMPYINIVATTPEVVATTVEEMDTMVMVMVVAVAAAAIVEAPILEEIMLGD
ncbi:hypothetical protein TIFTF001_051895 [Ficus carica]|uniref:Uncharacterized protein n=1 Tax=Ficus carica TaxID=3494 RepID=A0AA88JFF5_FICCA|nr:hypothetical protein TIFTF001_051895 [Ficus carica]